MRADLLLLRAMTNNETCNMDSSQNNLLNSSRYGGYRANDMIAANPYSTRPLLSIVTVVRNGGPTIEKTIQSVLEQKRKISQESIDYVVIDGASTDNTVKFIQHYEDQIAYWRSEPDKGIYDAMNKGWLYSQGHFVYFLGADDILLHIPYQALRAAIKDEIDLVYGNVLLSDGRIFIPSYNRMLTFTNTLHHQALFLRRDKFLKNPFKEQYRIFADFDLNQRLFKQKTSAQYVNESIARFSLTGVSVTTGTKEFFQVISSNYGVWAVIIAFLFAKYRGIQYRFWRLHK